MARRKHPIERADIAVARHVGAHHQKSVVRAAGFVSEIADQPPIYVIGWLVAAGGMIGRHPRLFRTGLRIVAAEWLATRAKNVIKHRIDRTRPIVLAQGGQYRLERGHSRAKPLTSFPSGHSAGAFAVARVVAAEYPDIAVTAYVLAGAAAAMQVPRAMHFPVDVAAGALLGWVTGGLVARCD